MLDISDKLGLQKNIHFENLFSCIFFLFIHSYTFSQNVVYKKYLYPNDSVSSEGNLIDNKPVGFWKTFHINGNLKSIGKWENGKLDSLWCFYNEEEKIIQKINYSKGKKMGMILFMKL